MSDFPETAHADRFDRVSHEYISDLNKNLKLTGSDSSYFYKAKIKMILEKVQTPPKVILDFGCGIGILSRSLAEAFPSATIFGYDPSTESIRVAQNESLPYGQRIFFVSQLEDVKVKPDLVIASGVFHHIHSSFQQKNLRNLFSSMALDAELFIFEHNPLNPVTRIIVAQAEVDRGACLIYPWSMKKMLRQSGFTEVNLEFISYFPPKLSPFLKLERYLTKIPLGAQYLVTAKKLSHQTHGNPAV